MGARSLKGIQRIMVVGCPGSGKSTFSQSLSKILDLPVIHLDSHFWSPGWVQTNPADWNRRVEELANQPRWVMDGNYSKSWPVRVPRAEAVIWLNMRFFRCISNVLRRWRAYSGTPRPDMAEGCPEKVDWRFLAFIADWHLKNRRRVLSRIAEIRPDLQPVVLKSFREMATFLDN